MDIGFQSEWTGHKQDESKMLTHVGPFVTFFIISPAQAACATYRFQVATSVFADFADGDVGVVGVVCGWEAQSLKFGQVLSPRDRDKMTKPNVTHVPQNQIAKIVLMGPTQHLRYKQYEWSCLSLCTLLSFDLPRRPSLRCNAWHDHVSKSCYHTCAVRLKIAHPRFSCH